MDRILNDDEITNARYQNGMGKVFEANIIKFIIGEKEFNKGPLFYVIAALFSVPVGIVFLLFWIKKQFSNSGNDIKEDVRQYFDRLIYHDWKKYLTVASVMNLIDWAYLIIHKLLGMVRKHYLNTYGITYLNTVAFAKNIQSFDKYTIESTNVNFPKKSEKTEMIQLNEQQTKKIVSAIVNKNFYRTCEEDELLCKIYNIRYNDIPMEKILQISNKYDSQKLVYLQKYINKYKTRIVISVRYESSLVLLKNLFEQQKFKFRILYPNSEEETEILRGFRYNEYDILLLHKEIIEGITVHNSQVLILFDVCTKYYLEQQVKGRCVRYKSHDPDVKNHVQIVKFVTTFKKKLLVKHMKKYKNPNMSRSENLNDKNKYKFLVSHTSPDEFYTELNKIIQDLYENI